MYTKKCRVLHIYRGASVNYSPTRVTCSCNVRAYLSTVQIFSEIVNFSRYYKENSKF